MTYPTLGAVNSSPAIGSDGTIYVGSEDSSLYAMNPDGTLKWKFNTGIATEISGGITLSKGPINSSPAIGNDGTIYVGSDNGFFYAVNPDGTLKWVFSTALSEDVPGQGFIQIGKGAIHSSPAIGDDGMIYVGSDNGFLYAISPEGDLKWAYETGDAISSSPAIGSDGTIFIGSEDKHFYAINPGGTFKWVFPTTGAITSSPAIGSDGTIYVGSGDKFLYAINSNGELKWSFETEGAITSSPAIGNGGVIYRFLLSYYLWNSIFLWSNSL